MRSLKVFLVHAVQDKPTVRELYARLKSESWLEPWFDEENLLPGQNWDLEIQKTLRNIDAIIICLSKVSIAKEGYIQKEIKRALDICDEKPEGTIYIIPLRLDDCELPFKLKKFHWVDYFNKNYDQKLLGALKARAESLGIPVDKSAAPVKAETYTPGGRPAYTFAEMDFVKVAASDFFMGADDIENAKPQHLVYQLNYDYYIGRYPVTNQDWSKFLREQNKPIVLRPEKLKHPVVNVSWHDAQEYIAWLNRIQNSEFKDLNLQFRLPSEAEWEKAARGVEGNIYPWGNSFDQNRCNSHESGIGDTTPVGKYSPQGDSAFGCADMAGNVWEWTRSLYDFKYPYARDERENVEAWDMVQRTVRGGSWRSAWNGVRAAMRGGGNPSSRHEFMGFRVAIVPLSLIK